MITMGTCQTSPEWGLPYAMAKSMSKTGFNIGDYVITKIRDQEYKCEITAATRRRLQLVGIGWVSRKKCHL